MESLQDIELEIIEKTSHIVEQYKDVPYSEGPIKYIRDIPLYVKKAYTRFNFLKLNESKNLKILDLCAGAGFFIYVCNKRHNAVGIDWPEYFSCGSKERIEYVPSFSESDMPVRLYEDLAKALGNTIYDFRIEAGKSFRIRRKFDLITGFFPCFNHVHETNYFWSIEDWDLFIKYLIDKHLSPKGRIALTLLRRAEGATEKEIRDLFLKKYKADSGPGTFIVWKSNAY